MSAARGVATIIPGSGCRSGSRPARRDGRTPAVSRDMQANFCDRGFGWACNEFGLLRARGARDDDAGAADSLRRGCALGFAPACNNLEMTWRCRRHAFRARRRRSTTTHHLAGQQRSVARSSRRRPSVRPRVPRRVAGDLREIGTAMLTGCGIASGCSATSFGFSGRSSLRRARARRSPGTSSCRRRTSCPGRWPGAIRLSRVAVDDDFACRAVSESLVKPRRNRTFGVPASNAQFSTLPSGFFTSICSQTWGLIHSIFVMVP